MDVLPATSGAEALRLLKANPGASMVLDIILPDQDGLAILREARALQPDRGVLAISGGGRLGPEFYLKLAHSLGPDGVIQKPFTAQQLIAGWRDSLTA